jgi:hypothetical protein
VNFQAHAANSRQPSGVPNLEQHTIGAYEPFRIELLDLSSDHELHELVGRGRSGQARTGRAPVSEHGDAITDAANLIEAVRDVDDADALGREPANHLEERLDLAFVQDRGRLVHDQQSDVSRQRPGDRHDLLGCRPQLAHFRTHGDRFVAQPGEERRRFPVHLVEVEQRPAARLMCQEDALGDA